VVDGSVFVDWLDIAQTHSVGHDDLPLVHGGLRVMAEEIQWHGTEHDEAGAPKLALVRCDDKGLRYSIKSREVSGSHSTKLRLRSDGRTVSLSGNVGRYGRPDNVWNYDLDETVLRASQIARDHGLPAFTPGECYEVQRLSRHDYDLGLYHRWTGAAIRQLHVTQNRCAGNPKMAIETMRYLQGHRAARLSKGTYGDETLQFGRTGGHKWIVVYRKAAEMLAHARGDDAKKAVKKTPEYQMAHDMGLIRIECKFSADYLRDHACRYIGDATMAKVISLFRNETAFLLDADPDRALRVVSELPPKLRSAALHWIRGDDLREIYPRATFFRHVKALRELGIDASEPRGERRQGGLDELQAMLDRLPKVDLRPLPPPEWYGLPEVRAA
jgi:X family protein